MEKIIFITGGARSGKSSYAQDIAKTIGKKVCFIATCTPKDDEMKKRVMLHKKSRPRSWKVIEENKNLKFIISKIKGKFDAIIIDCVGILIYELLSAGFTEKKIKTEIQSIINKLLKIDSTTIIVSNEVGAGIVPTTPAAREFRDLLGITNQLIAKRADTVYIMQVGIPVKIK